MNQSNWDVHVASVFTILEKTQMDSGAMGSSNMARIFFFSLSSLAQTGVSRTVNLTTKPNKTANTKLGKTWSCMEVTRLKAFNSIKKSN